MTHIGDFPSATYHYVERRTGEPSSILIYCLDGQGVAVMDNTAHPVRKGELLVIPPDCPHVYRAHEEDPWSILWIHFAGEQSRSLHQSLGVSIRHPLLHVADTSLMRNAFEDLYACLDYNYTDAGLLAMSAELLRFFSVVKLHHGSPLKLRQAAEDRVMATMGFMERHLDKPLTLQQLAAHAGQSVVYYGRLFKARTGQTPMAYFIQLKMRKAGELLLQTDTPVREIGPQVGYEDPYYFSRIFKKTQGVSPDLFRRTMKHSTR